MALCLYAASDSSSVCPAVCCSLCLTGSQSSWLYLNYPAYAGAFPCSTSVCLFLSPPLCSCIRMCICVHPCRQTTYGNTTAPLSLILSLFLYAHIFFKFYFNASLCLYVNPSIFDFLHIITATSINNIHRTLYLKCEGNIEICPLFQHNPCAFKNFFFF